MMVLSGESEDLYCRCNQYSDICSSDSIHSRPVSPVCKLAHMEGGWDEGRYMTPKQSLEGLHRHRGERDGPRVIQAGYGRGFR